MLDLRLTAADLCAGAGGASAQLGEVVRSHLQALIAAAGKVIIQPILDPTAPLAADSYEIPERIRRCVTALYPQVTFPYSNRSSTGQHVDLDHITVWPDGPTDNANLAPLDRRTHRAKTFAGYQLRPVRVGILHWTTPTGQQYWLTPHGTYDYHPETAPPEQPAWPNSPATPSTDAPARQNTEPETDSPHRHCSPYFSHTPNHHCTGTATTGRPPDRPRHESRRHRPSEP